jgi:tetrahydromethanopterin S-methyltransferase subunit G
MTRATVPAPSAKHGQDYIDALETRVSELEERLDFTEQLLAERRQTEHNA